MYRRAFRAVLAAPMQAVYSALLLELAATRWSSGTPADPPRAGLTYRRYQDGRERRGRVLEVRPPVGVTLREVTQLGSCRLHQLLRFALAPTEDGTILVIGAQYRPDGLARLRMDIWHRWLVREQRSTLARIDMRLAASDQGTGVKGHSTGNSNMTVANITRVRGRPIFK